ncbi:MAG: hypothetical protein ACOC3I_11755, partial [Verrucomicrobiota bacterium]
DDDRLADIWSGLLSVLRGLFWWVEGICEVPSQMADALRFVGRGLRWVLLLPWRLLKGLVSIPRSLFKGGEVVSQTVKSAGRSVADSAVDLRGSIESQPGRLQSGFSGVFRGLRNWYLNRGKWSRRIFVTAAVLFVMGAASAYPAWLWLKGWRSEQLLEQADELFAEGRSYQAFLKGQAAYYVDPTNTDVLTRLIEFSRTVRHPMTLRYGEELIARGAVSSAALEALTEEAKRTQSPDLARAFLRRLERVDPDNPELPRMRIELTLMQGDRGAALQQARAEVEAGDDTADVFGLYASLVLQAEANLEEEERAQVLEQLRANLEGGGQSSLIAAMLLLEYDERTSVAGAEEVVDIVLEHPEAQRRQKLRAYLELLRVEASDIEALRSEVQGLFDLTDSRERLEYALWLYEAGEHGEVIATTPASELEDSRTLFYVYILSLIEVNRQEEALELLRSPEAFVMPEIERLILEARTQLSSGREEAYGVTVERAIVRAEVDDFETLERFIRQLNDRRFMVEMYNRFSQFPSTAAKSKANLLLFAYEARDSERVQELLETMRVQDFRDYPVAQGLVAYLRGLRETGVMDNIREAESLVARFPAVMDFRVALALNYFQSGYIREAGEMLQGVQSERLRSVPGMYAVCETIRWVATSGFDEDAETVKELLNIDMLEAEREFLQGIVEIADPLAMAD